MGISGKQEFGRLRSVLFPIYNEEIKKFVPLECLFLGIAFVYSLLRGLKDVFIINSAGPGTIYYLKTFAVMPSVILFNILYSSMAGRCNRDGRWNYVMIYFFIFYLASSIYFIPCCKSLQLDFLADSLIASTPKFKGLWEAIRYWPYSLVYIHSEAWGTFALGVVFWTFANEIVTQDQAKRMYPHLMMGSSVGAILSGNFMLKYGDEIDIQMKTVTGVIGGLIIVYNIFTKAISKNPVSYQLPPVKIKKTKKKMGVWESIKFLAKSKYLALISIIVLSYNMFISLLESIWKGSIGEYRNVVALNGGNAVSALTAIYGSQSQAVGYVTLFLVFFVSAIVSRKSWRFVALFTPLVALLSSIVFLIFLKYQVALEPFAVKWNIAYPIYIAVIFGLGVVVFIKSSKYVFFDTTKERAYIPLDDVSRITGKAAVDSIGSRLGKSLGSFIISTILIPIFGDLAKIRYVTFVFIFIILALWIYAVIQLSYEYENKVKVNAASEGQTETTEDKSSGSSAN